MEPLQGRSDTVTTKRRTVHITFQSNVTKVFYEVVFDVDLTLTYIQSVVVQLGTNDTPTGMTTVASQEGRGRGDVSRLLQNRSSRRRSPETSTDTVTPEDP